MQAHSQRRIVDASGHVSLPRFLSAEQLLSVLDETYADTLAWIDSGRRARRIRARQRASAPLRAAAGAAAGDRRFGGYRAFIGQLLAEAT